MNKIIAALDGMDFKKSLKVLKPIHDKIHAIKINHPLLSHISDYKKEGYKVFADLKLHDIPNTVEKVIEWLIEQKVDMTTIHYDVGENCLERISVLRVHIKLLLVTHLTSLKSDTLKQKEIYKTLTYNGNHPYNHYDLIISPADLITFKEYDPHNRFKKYCPGIRLEDRKDDQLRTATPQEAIKNGADYLIIGRPLWENSIECFL
jgi:orotidine-5'-phosphate decarboxylase